MERERKRVKGRKVKEIEKERNRNIRIYEQHNEMLFVHTSVKVKEILYFRRFV